MINSLIPICESFGSEFLIIFFSSSTSRNRKQSPCTWLDDSSQCKG